MRAGAPTNSTNRTTEASRDFYQAVYPNIGAVVMGRRLFDQVDGWGGVPAAGDHVFVVTHTDPTASSTSPPARSAGRPCVWG